MKWLTALIGLSFLLVNIGFALAQDVWVNPYYRSDGTQVQGHYRTRPDSNPYNNYSTYGNTNPYTSQPGYHRPSYDSSGSFGTQQQPLGGSYNQYNRYRRD